MTNEEIVKYILDAFEATGHLDYGENISMEEHMLQTAHLAERAGESDAVVVAALLHDFGHLVCNLPNTTFDDGVDNYHESLGARALQDWFDDEIVGAVRLHVDAKRYLCAVSPNYFDKLSEASVVTLRVQGGPMNESEQEAFRRLPGHKTALRVRVFDDQGKAPHMERPELAHYVPKIEACIRSARTST